MTVASHLPIRDLRELRDRLRDFAAVRDWDQFHSPKNLAMALSVEVAELVEHFQWMTETESANVEAAKKAEIAQELADVLAYLVRIADKLDVDLLEAASSKMLRNEERYPVDRARGSARKYTEL